MSMDQDFPVLDFQEFNQNFDKFSRDVFEASKKWGFFILTGSGISKDNMFGLSRDFFDLPMEEKSAKILNETVTGYDGKTKTTFAASEGMSFGLPAGGVLQSDNIPDWFDTPKRQAIEDFKSECYELSGALMSCFAVRLGLDKSYFKESHLQKAPGNTLKLIKYPRLEKTSNDIPRLSEHTDWGSITFVFTDRAGLEIRDPNNKWFHIPVVPEGIVVNIGDALSLWTDRGLKSTMHRITWTNLPLDKDRYSIAYFTNPNLDAPLRIPSSLERNEEPTITYQDYYNVRLRLTYGSLKDNSSNKALFEDLDPHALEMVRKLNVANSGILESHAVTT